MERYTFKKEERLCNKRLLSQLFQSGSFFMFYPFRVGFLVSEAPNVPAQVVIGVPKKRFKRAVDRNLLKRRIREAYRLQKEVYLYSFLRVALPQASLLISLQYIAKDIQDYTFIFQKLTEALLKLQDEYRKVSVEKSN